MCRRHPPLLFAVWWPSHETHHRLLPTLHLTRLAKHHWTRPLLLELFDPHLMWNIILVYSLLLRILKTILPALSLIKRFVLILNIYIDSWYQQITLQNLFYCTVKQNKIHTNENVEWILIRKVWNSWILCRWLMVCNWVGRQGPGPGCDCIALVSHCIRLVTPTNICNYCAPELAGSSNPWNVERLLGLQVAGVEVECLSNLSVWCGFQV